MWKDSGKGEVFFPLEIMNKTLVGDTAIAPPASGVVAQTAVIVVVSPESMDNISPKRVSANDLEREVLPGGRGDGSLRQDPAPAVAPTVHRTTSFSVLDILDPNKFTSKKQPRTVIDFTLGAENRGDEESSHGSDQKTYTVDYDTCKKSSLPSEYFE